MSTVKYPKIKSQDYFQSSYKAFGWPPVLSFCGALLETAALRAPKPSVIKSTKSLGDKLWVYKKILSIYLILTITQSFHYRVQTIITLPLLP